MLVVLKNGDERVETVKHNRLDIQVLVAKAVLQSDATMEEVLQCSMLRE